MERKAEHDQKGHTDCENTAETLFLLNIVTSMFLVSPEKVNVICIEMYVLCIQCLWSITITDYTEILPVIESKLLFMTYSHVHLRGNS